MGIVYRVWDQARQRPSPTADTSLLGQAPLRPAARAVSLWLNAGVPATQVAEWAGHSVNVLLRVYAKCVVRPGRGRRDASRPPSHVALPKHRPDASPKFPHVFRTDTRK